MKCSLIALRGQLISAITILGQMNVIQNLVSDLLLMSKDSNFPIFMLFRSLKTAESENSDKAALSEECCLS